MKSESQDLLVLWNRMQTDYPRNACIQELFELQVKRTPEAIAVVFMDQQLTYNQLNEHANQLAHWLIQQGIGPDCLVGLCLSRSLEVIIGMLGILKAGGAYIPLDPSYPTERLSLMMEDTRLPVLLTQTSLFEDLPPHKAKLLCMDTQWSELEGLSKKNPPYRGKAENLAYVMYTSGSTGRPKGVEVTHRGVVRLLFGVDYVHLGQEETILQLAPISFDASTFEIWGALLHGGRCVMFPSQVPDPAELGEIIDRYGVSTLWLTASLFNIIISDSPQSLRGIKQLLTGGEALSVPHIRKALEHLPSTQLINGYGPTENTTFTCCYPIPRQLPGGLSSIPIGRPIANTWVYVLDSHMEPVPIGVPGELYIGGDGLARGYLNHPDLTAERFVNDPFSEKPVSEVPGSCLYRTGDMVRWLPEGILEFLGRKDDQVKLRGFRIELGEIESVLKAHESLGEAVVLLHEDEPGDKRLVGYIVPRKDVSLSVKDLRTYLMQKLPDYMVPSFFVQLESLPLTPNGKVDRKALLALDRSLLEREEDYVAPITPMEKLLAEIWKEVLRVKSVGTNDNFLILGGHSLHAVQIIARILDRLRIDLPLHLIFESANLGELAGYLEQRRDGKKEPHHSSIQLIDRNNPLPVSFSQERVYFIQQLDPENIAYNFQVVINLEGNLNVKALEQSLNEIIRRHEIYRTTFSTLKDGQVVQNVHDPFQIKLPVVDLRSLPESERNKESQWIIDKEIRKPFDISRIFLIRWVLIWLKDTEYKLIHVEHHLVHDGWSFNVFLGELGQLYKSFSNGKASPLPDLPIQFADFAHWQRQWMQGDVAEKQLAYWKEKLTGCPPLLELPYDHPRPLRQTFRGAAIRKQIPSDLYQAILDHNRKKNTTLFMSLFSAFVVLLHRYSGQHDICVGTGMANRRWRETEGLIGMIINNVVLRTDLSEDLIVRELLEKVRDISLEACTNQDLPFERVVEALHPERNLSHNPLFQVMFSLHDAPMPDVDLPGLKGSFKLGINNSSSKFDLTIIIFPQFYQYVGQDKDKDEKLIMVWEYNKDLFEGDTIDRMINHYLILLEQIISKPNQRISELSMLTASEKHKLLVELNDTKTEYQQDKCIHNLFEEQVERTTDEISLLFENQQLTYLELNNRANQLAHYLNKNGIVSGTLVGICLERSIEMVVGLIGILKAGAAYVPIDPEYPKDRIGYMLMDSEIKVLLTQERLLKYLPKTEKTKTICLDTDFEKIKKESKENVNYRVPSENLAYVIYTSGTTGRPKGVCISHSSLVNHMNWIQRTYSIDSTDIILQKTPYSFDASVWEFYAPLLVGGKLVIAKTDGHKDPLYLIELINRYKITILQVVPSLLKILLDTKNFKICSSLKTVFCGGEPLHKEIRDQFFSLLNASLVNLYGPTECTIDSTHYLCSEKKEETIIPIGKPIDNTQIFILDANKSLVPIGIPGELYIGGSGLARGYLNRPDLTAKKFVPNPFSQKSGERLYKTGDLARYLPDGNIEYLGRLDHQVKIRGFRIELGEIESVLRNHESVQEAVVLLREDKPGDKRLVGYVAPSADVSLSSEDLQIYLRQKLPDYMVPSYFMMLRSLPLTPSGKVDRHALPKPDAQSQSKKGLIRPRTDIELTIASIWCDTLHLDEVGIYDNFFDLGGHSLLAMRVIIRLVENLGINLPLNSIFENPTIEGLARFIEAFQWAGHGVEMQVGTIIHGRESGEL